MKKQVEFADLVGKKFNFYGVDGLKFKIGRYIFEVIADESDSYRSYMDKVTLSAGGTFKPKPITKVIVEDVQRPEKRKQYEPVHNIDSGYRLKDAKDGYIWLQFGTDNEDDYYPSFVFDDATQRKKKKEKGV